ncbi:DUF969 family protein [Paenibacillus sp. LMG 31458]|uniref:DUF969 family protein n=1 Tax=Paenibacillus phytorum TaxID=2654977 RepID=A0ABX1XXE7_9BACL|nr:DUF969 domain-containing protein [Paenibacillus phytorum]NOU73240.1 DUF969 family protein [Paenibacillus phytorum]
MLSLIGILIVIVGFALRFNPLLVVTVAGIATGLAGHLPLEKIVTTFGEAFVKNRYLSLFILTLPVIGLLERNGLKEQAQRLIGKVKAATPGRILILYLFIREAASALGLTSLGGHAQMVRPLVAPMAEGAAENKYGKLPEKVRNKIKAFAASSDNVGLFFGEDIFIAFGAILLMKGFFEQNGIMLEPLDIAVWGIPTAIAAFLIHSTRLFLFDRTIQREIEADAVASKISSEKE